MRIVVLGGSGASTPELFDALAAWPGDLQRRPPLEVVLVGRSAAKLELVAMACRGRAPLNGPAVSVGWTTDRRAALDGTDVVLNQVRVGGLAARRFDESFPRELGLPGEETMGPGGFANALRTVPALRAAWQDVAEIAPGALAINLTNPSGIVVAAARREFDLRIVSVCDSPISHTAAIATRLGRSVERVRRRYVGMNHVGWYVPEASDELVTLADLAIGLTPQDLEIHEAVGAPYVRYYVHPDRILAAQSGQVTRAETLMGLETELLDAYAANRSDGPRRGAAWYGLGVVPVLDAWTNGATQTLIAGTVEEPVGGGMVEGPVLAPTPGRLEPLEPVALPALPAAVLAAHAAYERATVDAILAGSPRVALVRALLANPMVVDADRAGRLVDAILAGSPGGVGAA
jgi:6-phospho-beta-glucosidase